MTQLPVGLRWSETASEEAGFSTDQGVVPRRWGSEPGIISIIAAKRGIAERKKEEGLERLAEWKAVKAQETAHLPKRPRGRPKGSKNKSKRGKK